MEEKKETRDKSPIKIMKGDKLSGEYLLHLGGGLQARDTTSLPAPL